MRVSPHNAVVSLQANSKCYDSMCNCKHVPSCFLVILLLGHQPGLLSCAVMCRYRFKADSVLNNIAWLNSLWCIIENFDSLGVERYITKAEVNGTCLDGQMPW